MSDRQVIHGCLSFAPGALSEALDALADELDPLIVELLREARVEDDLLVLTEDGFFPASLWHDWTGAVAELTAVAQAGLVACVYQGDGDEILALEASGGRPRARLGEPSAPGWFELTGGPRRYARRGGEGALELRPVEVAPRVFALRIDDAEEDFNDLLGVTYLAPDGDRLYVVDAYGAAQLSALDLSAPSPALQLAVDAAQGGTRLVHLPGSEVLQLWRVESPAEADELRVRVTEHFVSTDARDHRERALRPPLERTLSFARGRGLVRAELPRVDLVLAPHEAVEAPERTGLVLAILVGLVILGLLVLWIAPW